MWDKFSPAEQRPSEIRHSAHGGEVPKSLTSKLARGIVVANGQVVILGRSPRNPKRSVGGP